MAYINLGFILIKAQPTNLTLINSRRFYLVANLEIDRSHRLPWQSVAFWHFQYLNQYCLKSILN